MKLTGRQSSNLQDKRQDAGASFPHASVISNPMANALRKGEQDSGDATLAKVKKLPKDNPFRKMVKGMDMSMIKFHKSQKDDRKAGRNPKIPLPTPRPDPGSKAGPKTFGDG